MPGSRPRAASSRHARPSLGESDGASPGGATILVPLVRGRRAGLAENRENTFGERERGRGWDLERKQFGLYLK